MDAAPASDSGPPSGGSAGALHTGQVGASDCLSHLMMHVLWYSCLHGSVSTACCARSGSRQTAQLLSSRASARVSLRTASCSITLAFARAVRFFFAPPTSSSRSSMS